MINELQKGQIGLCDIVLLDAGNRKYIVRDAVFSHPYDRYREVLRFGTIPDMRVIRKTKAKTDLEILEIRLKKPIGWRNRKKNPK